MSDTRRRPDEPTYFALIGDIVASREMEDRAAVQRKLRELLESLNRELEGSGLVSPLKLVAGDEVQGLLANPEGVLKIAVRVADELHPVSLTWGFGMGGLTTDLDSDVSTMDGPCFHRARVALEEAARAGSWLRAGGVPSPHGEVLGALFRLMGAIRAEWTETQVKYVREVRTGLQRDVAKAFDVDESTVSESLKKAHYRDLVEGEEASGHLLGWLRSQIPTGSGEGRSESPQSERVEGNGA